MGATGGMAFRGRVFPTHRGSGSFFHRGESRDFKTIDGTIQQHQYLSAYDPSGSIPFEDWNFLKAERVSPL
jgi:hypothetical protein